jgi:hypothetical protein
MPACQPSPFSICLPGRRAFLAAMALIALPLLTAGSLAAEPKPPTVRLVVDFGDGVQTHFTALPWSAEMTVLDALVAAQKHPHGITFAQRGRGASTLITQIADLKNEGSGKNWLFSVNGETSTEGAGTRQLERGDAVLWEFKAYE